MSEAWAAVPESVIRRTGEITPLAFRVLCAVLLRADRFGVAWAVKPGTIAELLGLSKTKRVSAALRELVEAGFLVSGEDSGRPCWRLSAQAPKRAQEHPQDGPDSALRGTQNGPSEGPKTGPTGGPETGPKMGGVTTHAHPLSSPPLLTPKAHKRQQLALAPPAGGVPEGLQRLHAVWSAAVGKPTWGLNEKRSKELGELLRQAGSMERAELALRGLGLSAFHMGREPGGDGRTGFYGEPRYALRHMDRFIEAAQEASRPAPLPPSSALLQEAANATADFFEKRGDPRAHSRPLPEEQVRKFKAGAVPVGIADVEGEEVLVFLDPLLNLTSGNLAGARYAKRVLTERYGSHPDAQAELIPLLEANVRSCLEDLRRHYASHTAAPAAHPPERHVR